MKCTITLRLFLIIIVTGTAHLQLSAQDGPVGGSYEPDLIPYNNQRVAGCIPISNINTPEGTKNGLGTDGQYLWSGSFVGSQFHKSDMVTGNVVLSIPKPPAGTPFKGGDLDFDGTNLWATIEQDGILFKIDPANGNVLDQFTLPIHSTNGNPNHWGVACKDSFVWYCEYDVINGPGLWSLLVKTIGGSTILDTIYIPYWISSIKFLDDELWAIGFTEPYMYHVDTITRQYIDSVPSCVTSNAAGIDKNSFGLWVMGNLAPLGNRIYLMDDTGVSVPEYGTPTLHSVYPNPSSDLITVTINDDVINGTFTLYDVHGRAFALYEFENTSGQPLTRTFNISHIPSGVYTLKAEGKRKYVNRIVKM